MPLFPPYGARFLNHIHAIPLGRAAHRNARVYALIIVRESQRECELIPDARITNNRVQWAGCGLSRPVIPRVQQRDCSEQVSERASERTAGRTRSPIRRVNRVRNNNIYKR